MTPRRFPPPWSVEEPGKLNRRCFIVRDGNGQALAYVYFEGELGRRAAAHRITGDQTRRIAAYIAKLPEPCCGGPDCNRRTASASLMKAKDPTR